MAKSDESDAPAEDQLAVLQEMRDVQREMLATQRMYLWILLPIFALLTILVILALTGFLGG